MSHPTRFAVVVTGHVRDGVAIEHALAGLAALTRRPEPELRGLLQGKRYVVRKGLSFADAVRYRSALQEVGIIVDIESGEDPLALDVPLNQGAGAHAAAEATSAPSVAMASAHILPQPSTSQEARVSHQPTAPALWNPSAAIAWSWLFTPLFGGLLHASNWEVLGDREKAIKSRAWAWLGLTLLLVTGIVEAYNRGTAYIAYVYGPFWFLTWYLMLGRRQSQAVRTRYGSAYARRRWSGPLLIAVSAFVLIALFGKAAAPHPDRQPAPSTSLPGAVAQHSISPPTIPSTTLGAGDFDSSTAKPAPMSPNGNAVSRNPLFDATNSPLEDGSARNSSTKSTLDEPTPRNLRRESLVALVQTECARPGLHRMLESAVRTVIASMGDGFNRNGNGAIFRIESVRLTSSAPSFTRDETEWGCNATLQVSATLTPEGSSPRPRTMSNSVFFVLAPSGRPGEVSYDAQAIRSAFGELLRLNPRL